MLNKTEIILLKSVFNEKLHHAIINKDINAIEKELLKYQGEYIETEIDIEYIYKEHIEGLENDDFKWAL